MFTAKSSARSKGKILFYVNTCNIASILKEQSLHYLIHFCANSFIDFSNEWGGGGMSEYVLDTQTHTCDKRFLFE
jgi:hypothetical protein